MVAPWSEWGISVINSYMLLDCKIPYGVWGSAPDTYSQRRSEPAVKLSASGITRSRGREFDSSGRADWEMVDHGGLCKLESWSLAAGHWSSYRAHRFWCGWGKSQLQVLMDAGRTLGGNTESVVLPRSRGAHREQTSLTGHNPWAY